jgi:hypothetical protein
MTERTDEIEFPYAIGFDDNNDEVVLLRCEAATLHESDGTYLEVRRFATVDDAEQYYHDNYDSLMYE